MGVGASETNCLVAALPPYSANVLGNYPGLKLTCLMRALPHYSAHILGDRGP